MKQFFRIFIPILLLLLLGYAIYHIWEQRQDVEKNEKLATQYKQALEDEQLDKQRLTTSLNKYADQNLILRDSVRILRGQVSVLKKQLREKVETIAQNEARLNSMRSKMSGLENEIAALRNRPTTTTADANKLKDLENQRFALDKQIGDLFMKNQELEQENNQLVVQLVEKEKNRDAVQGELDKTKNDLAGATGEGEYQVEGSEGTLVNINAIEAEFGRVQALTKKGKPARSTRKWQDTEIQFDLIYPNVDNLINQNFSLQLLDEDTGKTLSPRESNRGAFDAKGVEFAFTGNPVKVKFVNYQDKKNMGTNYTARLFFIDATGKEVPLASAVAPVVFKR